MTITLYKTTDEEIKVTKTLTDARVLTGALKEVTGIFDAAVLIEGNYPSENYAYITEFDKYYIIRNVQVINNNLWLLEMEEDVLMTFNTGIRNLEAIIERQESDFNPYLIDPEAPLEADHQLYIKKLGGYLDANNEPVGTFSTKNNLVLINSLATAPAE